MINYEGIATIEIIDNETKKIEKTIEHNMLSPLYDNIFNSNQYDAVVNYSSEIKKYFNKLVLLNGVPKNGDLIADNIHVISVLSPKTQVNYDDTGLEMTYEISGDDLYEPVDCICLAPEQFANLEEWSGNNTLISGKFEGKLNLEGQTGTGGFQIVNIDFDNNWVYSLELKSRTEYKKGTPFFAYFRKYYHNFEEPTLTSSDVFSMKLLESTEIDLTEMLSDVNGIGYSNPLNYSVDEQNKRLILIYNNNANIFRTCVFSIDNTSDVQFYNMKLPNYIDTGGYGIRSNSNYPFQIPSYHGRVCIPTKITVDGQGTECWIGINPINTTDLEVYNIVYLESMKRNIIDTGYTQLLGTGTGTCVTTKIMIKDNFVFSLYNNNFNTSNFYHKSKKMSVWGTDTFYIEYKMPSMIVSTINEMSKQIFVSKGKTMKITYRLTQK